MDTPQQSTAATPTPSKPKKERIFKMAASAAATTASTSLPDTSVTGAPKSEAPVVLMERKDEGKEESKEEKPKPKTTKTRRLLLAASASQAKVVPEKSYQEKLIDFYQGRKREYESYSYSPEGNLVIKEKGVEIQTIPLRRFRDRTSEELTQLEEERLQGNKATGEKGIIDLENEFDIKLAALRKAEEQYRSRRGSAKTVVLANKEVINAQQLLTARIAPERVVLRVSGLHYKDIQKDRPKDDRALGYDALLLLRRNFKRADLMGRYMTPEEEEALKVVGQEGGSSQDVFILDNPEDPDMGPLHPFFVKDFTYAATQYSSPLQAFEVERLRELKEDALVQQLMKTRSIRNIQNLAQHQKSPAPNAYELWAGILKAYYGQHKEYAEKLKETGDALFTLRDTSIPSSQEFLRALLNVRATMREGEEAVQTDTVNRVITEEEQQRAKVGAIIRNRNKLFHRG